MQSKEGDFAATGAAGGCCASRKKTTGPGYASPTDAFRSAPRECVLFVTCVNLDGVTADGKRRSDALVTVDVDPQSSTYCQIVGRWVTPHVGDELHHSGWNACSSCFGDASKSRRYMVLPCLGSSRIYVVDTADSRALRLHKTIEADELRALDLSTPHTAHCLADGNIMVSTIGNANGDNSGSFALIDSDTYAVVGRWLSGESGSPTSVRFGYDFWYQPRWNVMISTGWGSPNRFRSGFRLDDLLGGHYAGSVYVWNWRERTLRQTIDLCPDDGGVPLEVRFLHNPTQPHAFFATAVGGAIYHVHRDETSDSWLCERSATVAAKRVRNWTAVPGLDRMPAMLTDILVSMDDRFLYVSCWLHGDVRQYDITDPFNVRLVGQCFVGGCIHTGTDVEMLEDEELKSRPEPLELDGRRVEGGPQMLQLSLDGRRLYVSTSLYSPWDAQFYPKLVENGGVILQLDVNTEGGGLSVNRRFRVDASAKMTIGEGGDDSGNAIDGRYAFHEMRYPGGDCTSDIWP